MYWKYIVKLYYSLLQTKIIYLFTTIDARHHRGANLMPVHKLIAITASLFCYRFLLKSKVILAMTKINK